MTLTAFRLYGVAASMCILVSLLLLSLNIYGLTQNLRPQNLDIAELRFGDKDVQLGQFEFASAVKKGVNENDETYVQRLVTVVADGMAHLEWEAYDAPRFYQRVPIWENYILWALPLVSSMPELNRYHFTLPDKSIERGIGVCGDAVMLMSQLLDRQGIGNSIITIPGHVLLEVELDGSKTLFDPDFGVALNLSVQEARDNPTAVKASYLAADRYDWGVEVVVRGLQGGLIYWGGTQDFVFKRYYFERGAYFAKWAFPIGLCIVAFFVYRYARTKPNSRLDRNATSGA